MNEMNYQNAVLNECRRSKTKVVVFITNGYQIRGTITAYNDDVVVLVDPDGKQMMIYKHAISTVVPGRHIDLS